METLKLEEITRSINPGEKCHNILSTSDSDCHSNEYDATKNSENTDKTVQNNKSISDTSNNENANLPYVNAARERSRVKTLRSAFLELQRALPSVPPDTKLSKLDVLVLATSYIGQLMRALNEGVGSQFMNGSAVTCTNYRLNCNNTVNDHFRGKTSLSKGFYHPVKKWPMRSRLYADMNHKAPVTSSVAYDVMPKSPENTSSSYNTSSNYQNCPSSKRVNESSKKNRESRGKKKQR